MLRAMKILVTDFALDNRRKLKFNKFEQSLLIDLCEEYLAQVDDMIECACEDDMILTSEEELLEMTNFIYQRREAATKIHKELVKYDIRYQ